MSERIEKINTNAVKHLEDYLMQIENEELDPDDLLSVIYAGMIAAKLLGYSPHALADDAEKAATRLSDHLAELEADSR